MLNKIFNRQSRLEHPDPAERIAALADEGVDPADVARLLGADPSPDVRRAAAMRATDPAALAAAATRDADDAIRRAAAERLGALLASEGDDADAVRWLGDRNLPDEVRIEAAKHTERPDRRNAALDAIGNEAALVAIAIDADRTDTRLAAAERISSEQSLQQLHNAARNKDHGVAKAVRQRLDSMRNRSSQAADADSILDALEALATEPGPILTAVVELNRRWQALDLTGDSERLSRAERARQGIQARFDREQEQQRAKAQYDRRLREWTAALASMPLPPTSELAEMRATLAALRDEARTRADAAAESQLGQAERRIAGWEAEHTALAGAEALVDEAERLAADTSIDDAQLPARWQSLDRATRTPELTRRFEAALTTVEKRRLAQVQATMQQATAAKQQLHSLLHAAEQSLAAGKLQPARTALDEARALKTAAGVLPKPTIQRMSRAVQQLSDLERWESFGQQTARTQLVERAEALAAQPGDLAHVAQEVQKLRNEWKTLDEQYKGVPKALWERFDSACEKAYAPAARHFAEIAQQRKDARKKREDYIAKAATEARALLGLPPDPAASKTRQPSVKSAPKSSSASRSPSPAVAPSDISAPPATPESLEASPPTPASEASPESPAPAATEASGVPDSAPAATESTPAPAESAPVSAESAPASAESPAPSAGSAPISATSEASAALPASPPAPSEARPAAPPDWRAAERWLRETEHGWHEGGLGSVDPGTWKKLETKLKEAVAPVRDALSAARARVKSDREAMIAEVNALLPKALERDTPARVKAIQQRWQENARQLALLQRDERVLWEQFRAACDAVFTARQSKRSEEETRKSENRRALDAVAAELEQLARSKDTAEPDIRRAAREVQDKWKRLTTGNDPAVREVEPRFRRAKAALDEVLADRSRARESAVWQTLDAKERACEALERVVRDGGQATDSGGGGDAGSAALARADDEWSRLPALPPAWEKAMLARRDEAKRALTDPAAADRLRTAMTRTAPARREILLELELTLGLDTPRELQAERLALQVRQLKERFKSSVTASPETAGERYAQWCAMPGVIDAADRTRCERIVAALGSARGRIASGQKRDR